MTEKEERMRQMRAISRLAPLVWHAMLHGETTASTARPCVLPEDHEGPCKYERLEKP